jgi:hypothetical protein
MVPTKVARTNQKATTKKQQPKRTPDEGNTTRLLVVLHVGLFKKVLQSG